MNSHISITKITLVIFAFVGGSLGSLSFTDKYAARDYLSADSTVSDKNGFKS